MQYIYHSLWPNMNSLGLISSALTKISAIFYTKISFQLLQTAFLRKMFLESLTIFGQCCPSYWSQWIPEICNKTDCPKNKYMLKVNNKKTRERCEICSKLTRKIPERRHWRQLLTFSEPANVHWTVSMLQKLASNELNLKSSTTCIKFFVWLVSFLRIWGS